MIKNFTIAVLMIFSLVMFVGCAQTQQLSKDQAKVTGTPSQPAATGQASVDKVATGISDINNADKQLNNSALEDLDNTLADIEKI